jgi:molybdate transport system substrate-binding protein
MRFLGLVLLLAGCGAEPARAPLTVFAAASLRELVTELAAGWTAATGRPHRLQFEASSTLARQVLEGMPADVFLSAAPEWLDRVRLLERFDWLSNRLVLVVPKDAKDPDLKALGSLALTHEQAPAGKYAREALAHLGVPLPGRTISGQTVRDVLSKVSQGGAEAGVVYATDVPLDPGVRAAFTFPRESHSRILYSAGLLRAEGKAFFDTLRALGALDAARRLGFEALP